MPHRAIHAVFFVLQPLSQRIPSFRSSEHRSNKIWAVADWQSRRCFFVWSLCKGACRAQWSLFRVRWCGRSCIHPVL